MRSAPVLRRLGTSFARCERGNVFMMFGFMAVPLIGMVGAAIDYSMAATLRTRLQAATDTTTLSIARQADKLNKTQLTALAKATLKAEVPDANIDVDDVSVSAGGTELTLKTSGISPTNFMGLFGVYQIPLGVTTKTVITTATYEIAMVMDNSGSMASSAGGKSKMDSAKDAANSLVDIMFGSVQSAEKTKISLVPFTLSVKIGTAYAGAPWMDTTGISPVHWDNLDKAKSVWKPQSRFDIFTQLGLAWEGCVEARSGLYTTTDAPGTMAQPASLFVPHFAPDEPGAGAATSRKFTIGTGSTTYSYSNSYLPDKEGVVDASCTAAETTPDKSTYAKYANSEQNRLCKYRNKPTLNLGAGARGPNENCDAKPLTRMTDDAVTLKSSIALMAAAGNTDLLEGFMWGWRTVSPNNPFADGQAYDAPNNHKIIILMTDGMNNWGGASNQDYTIFSPFGYMANNRLATGGTTAADARSQIDAKTLMACNNAKAQNITVYTVGFSVSSDPIDTAGKNLLNQCATSPKTAYIAENSSQIVEVFEEIAKNIGGLRVIQ